MILPASPNNLEASLIKEPLKNLVKVQINYINWFPFIHVVSRFMTPYKTDSAFTMLIFY